MTRAGLRPGDPTSVRSWHLGKALVTRVTEVTPSATLDEMFPAAAPGILDGHSWLRPRFVGENGRLRMSVHSFVIYASGLRILVDTCIGVAKQRSYPGAREVSGTYLADLASAGHSADSIDVVVATHLHFDHIGWHTRLVGSAWQPTFTHARYLIVRAEWEYWAARAEAGHPPIFDSDTALADSISPLVQAGVVELVPADYQISDEVRLLPTPGHTPGHVAVWIDAGSVQAVITGDLIHSPAQLATPDLVTAADEDPVVAAATRRDFLALCQRQGAIVLGTHFPDPTAGKLDAVGDSWRLSPPEANSVDVNNGS